MPRRKHRRGDGADSENRTERIAVFEKTKMCKFFILGVCTKSDECRFAHDRVQLQTLPDLSRTKLCKTLIATGQCNNPACRYAHNKEEMRPMPDGSTKQLLHLQHQQQTVPGRSFTAQANTVAPAHEYSQMAYNSAFMHVAIAQFGQAAQAHAVEAARLQAMAAQLQGGTISPSAIEGSLPLTQALREGASSNMDDCHLGHESAEHTHELSGKVSDVPRLTVKNTFIDFTEPSSVKGMRTISSAAGRLCSMADGWDNSSAGDSPLPGISSFVGGFPSNCGKKLAGPDHGSLNTDEPVRTTSGKLRTVSSGSLPTLAEEESQAAWHGPSGFGKLLSRVEELPSSLEKRAQDTPPLSRTTEECGARLHHNHEVACSSGESVGIDDVPCQRQVSGGTGSSTGPAETCALDVFLAIAGSQAASENTAVLVDQLAGTGITVKHTFLDVASPKQPLRAVQTAGGRLDLMAEE